MLVLTRKLMEKLYIGDEICVTVVRLEGGQVRLGIEAPREIAVVRAELLPGRRPESGIHSAPSPSPAPGPEGEKPPVTTRPTLAHGIDSRRRGPSR
jgi:carbon storage regulator